MATFTISEFDGVPELERELLNRAIEGHLQWFADVIGRENWSIGFVVELALHSVRRGYNTHTIRDEIAVLEGKSYRPSITKPAKKFRRSPLIGLWHKHHSQTCFMAENILLEINRTGDLEKRLSPYFGEILGDVLNEVTREMVDGSYLQRANRRRMTGDFIVFEKLGDGSNFYLTLGNHHEYDAIAKRVEDYRCLDRSYGHRV